MFMKEKEEKVTIKKGSKGIINPVNSKTTSDEEKVNAWMNNLDPKVKVEINAVRKFIKIGSPQLNERIKWNAPSYYYKEDILTFGPYKTQKLLLVFHHPAVINIKSKLLKGTYTNRRLAYFKDKAAAEANKKELTGIINKIITDIDKKYSS